MKKYQSFLPENFRFLEVKFSLYLNRRVFVMDKEHKRTWGDIGKEKKFFFVIFHRFIRCIIRNTCSFYGTITGHDLPVHWPLFLKVITRKSEVTHIKHKTSLRKIQCHIDSRLSLSRSPKDTLKSFEISAPRHIRFAELMENKTNNHISQMNM